MSRLRLSLVPVLLAAALVGAAPAHADLRADSHNALKVGSGADVRLAMPLPEVTGPVRIVARRDGSVRLRMKVRYRASNWRGSRGVSRDRVLVTFRVARALLPGGPDPSSPRWRRTIAHDLRQRTAERVYAVTLPATQAAFLRRRGVFSKDATRRAAARRLVWADTQQDRDFLHADGRWDWREGNASNAADPAPRASSRRTVAHAASNDGCGANSPCGTVTVQNQTGNGVYSPTSTYGGTGGAATGSMPGTAGQTGVSLAVGGTAMQCFNQGGVGGSNPEGFANDDPSGTPQMYEPGGVAPGPSGNPISEGMAVTQPISADDSIASATNNQIAASSGLLQGVLNEAIAAGPWLLGLTGLTDGYSPNLGGLAMIAMGESSLPLPSPGAIVSASLDIAEAVIANSCDGNLNLMGLAAAEPGGGLAAGTISASKEGFAPASAPVAGATTGTAGSLIAGTQLNPSQSMYNGSPLYLQPDLGGGGVQGNDVDSSDNVNFVDYVWTNFNPCQIAGNVTQVQPQTSDCDFTPASSPVVTSSTGNVNCGAGNASCPFPAAGFPAGASTVFDQAPFGVTQPSAAPPTSLGYNECATVMDGGYALPTGQSLTSPNGSFSLTMQPGGTLTLVQNNASGTPTRLWSASGSAVAGSYAALQMSGNLAVLAPTTAVGFVSGSTTIGAPQLAVRNDGNVIVYDTAGGNAVWSTNTAITSCSSTGPSSTPTSTTPLTTTGATGCATLLAASDTQYLPGTTITSPNGSYTLAFNGALSLYPTALGSAQYLWTSTAIAQNPPAAVGAGVPTSSPSSYFTMQTNGEFDLWYPGPGVYSPPGTDGPTIVFSSNTTGSGNVLAVQNDGNLVVYDASNTALWSTNTFSGTPCPAP